MDLKKYQNEGTFFIHYACGNFLDEENPTISAIAIKQYGNGKPIETFSLAKEAAKEGIDIEDGVDEETIQELEFLFLKAFYERVEPRIKDEVQWIHWNMVNQGYSWRKINERIRQLGVESKPIEPSTKDSHDLSEFFQEKYDVEYVEDKRMQGYTGHDTSVRSDCRKGKLYNLAIINGMMRDDFLHGKEEYELLLAGKGFGKIQSSTVRKVQFIEEFLKRDVKGNLKVQKNAPLVTRIKRKLIENPLISIAFATAISFFGSLVPDGVGMALFVVFTAITVWLFIKD